MRIGHRCRCRHSDLNHDSKGKCTGQPCRRRCSPKKAEVLPTFGTNGRPIQAVVQPGCGLATMDGNAGPQTHNCADCRALYTQVTGIDLESVSA